MSQSYDIRSNDSFGDKNHKRDYQKDTDTNDYSKKAGHTTYRSSLMDDDTDDEFNFDLGTQ